jgi:hypothetical protein
MKISGWSRKSEVLSYFEYPQPDGTHVKRYIEPLHGTARHPGAVCGGHDMMDLKYLLPENACTESGNRVNGFSAEFSKNSQTFPMNRIAIKWNIVQASGSP